MQTESTVVATPYFAAAQRKNDGVANAAAVQIVSGLTCIGLQVFLFAYYHDDVENIHDGGALFTLAVGSFGVLAGIFGCLRRDLYNWINYMYFLTSLGVVCSSVFYFLSGYWNFYSSLKSNLFYLVVSSEDDEQQQQEHVVPTSYDDLHFWLKAASFLSVVVMALFSLAALVVVCADRCFSRNKKADDYTSLLVSEQHNK